ncbi:unnamed protein product [Allacma fusca]|uniref:Uncharacterized protein n=1 Tax=Allacma fusca TaxID=39272 RepID=A0A8J2P1N1_9HEXA|nr:unnamed protein product [Allacma fusca]
MSTEVTIGKKKSSRRIVAAKESLVLSFEAVAPLEFVIEDEEDDISFDLVRTGTEMSKERHSIDKLCHSIVDHFWETAWSVCAERFYFGTAPLSISLELRNTWLRILEAEWLDQDQPQMKFSPEVFQSDEPPPPLVIESPSTELFLNSRPLPHRLQVESSIGGSGEPLASIVSVPTKKKKKTKSKSKGKNDTGSNKSKVKPKSKKVIAAKKRSQRKPGGKNKSRGKSKPKSKKLLFKPEESKEPNVSAESEVEEETEQLLPECVPPPPPKPDLPWEVIFLNKQLFLEASNLSPSLSEEYKRLGEEPWCPSKSGGSTGVFRLANQSSCTMVPPSKMTSLKDDARVSTNELQADPVKLLEGGAGSVDVAINRSPQSAILIKKGEQLESTDEVKLEAMMSPVNVLERIDNLLAADSDHVVEILRPTEAERIKRDNSAVITYGTKNGSDRDQPRLNSLPGKRKSLNRRSLIPRPQQPKKQSAEKQRTKPTKPVTSQSVKSTAVKGVKEKVKPTKPTKLGPRQV